MNYNNCITESFLSRIIEITKISTFANFELINFGCFLYLSVFDSKTLIVWLNLNQTSFVKAQKNFKNNSR